jgi:hypothetical protein
MNHPHSPSEHPHKHGPGCGHMAIKHEGHTDYLHDGHLHHVDQSGVSDHTIPVSAKNPSICTKAHPATGHVTDHVHGPGCGHAAVPHGDHVDYLVDGKLHHPHEKHCDDHGPVQLA